MQTMHDLLMLHEGGSSMYSRESSRRQDQRAAAKGTDDPFHSRETDTTNREKFNESIRPSRSCCGRPIGGFEKSRNLIRPNGVRQENDPIQRLSIGP